MIKIPSRAQLQVITGDKPEPVKADPQLAVNQALEALAKQTNIAMLLIGSLAEQKPEAKPSRLEADVQRDKAGKMTRIVITPIYAGTQ